MKKKAEKEPKAIKIPLSFEQTIAAAALETPPERGRIHLNFAGLLDNPFQGSAHVATPLLHEPQSMSVAIHSVATDGMLLRNGEGPGCQEF